MSIFFMMVGLPYSGKSVYAEGLREKFGAEIHSSDAIRAEILEMYRIRQTIRLFLTLCTSV